MQQCGECKVDFKPGFVIDRGHMEYKTQLIWVEGEPEESFWSGVKTSSREALNTVAKRCPSCGKLEFYTTTTASNWI